MTTMRWPIYFSLFFLLACGGRSPIDDDGMVEARVVSVIDGDTYDVILQGGTQVRIRMAGIDAPERGMPYYNTATDYLESLCMNRRVFLRLTKEESYDRVVAEGYLPDGLDLEEAMVRAGLAWHFKKYSSDTVLDRLEREARASGLAIWSEPEPMSPWENRRLHRNGISTKDRFSIGAHNR